MKKILVTQSSMPSLEEYVEEIKDMWDTHWLTNMGPKHKKFQEELKQYLGVENIDLMTNGHMALELSLQALNLSGEDSYLSFKVSFERGINLLSSDEKIINWQNANIIVPPYSAKIIKSL